MRAHPELNDTLVPSTVTAQGTSPGCPTNFCVQATAFVNNRVGGDINFNPGNTSISCSTEYNECQNQQEIMGTVPSGCESLVDTSPEDDTSSPEDDKSETSSTVKSGGPSKNTIYIIIAVVGGVVILSLFAFIVGKVITVRLKRGLRFSRKRGRRRKW